MKYILIFFSTLYGCQHSDSRTLTNKSDQKKICRSDFFQGGVQKEIETLYMKYKNANNGSGLIASQKTAFDHLAMVKIITKAERENLRQKRVGIVEGYEIIEQIIASKTSYKIGASAGLLQKDKKLQKFLLK